MSDYIPDVLSALSPLDGRYAGQVAPLRAIFSEFGLIHRRIRVELAWFKALCACDAIPEARPLTADETAALDRIDASFSLDDARRVKAIEARTNHDVKAIEYYLRERLDGTSLAGHAEFIHFACTSEDINNVAHALMLRDGLAVLRDAQNRLLAALTALAHGTRDSAMLARTHGQAASPTTLGKELAVFVHRLQRQSAQLDALEWPAKLNGAVGNYNAHLAAYPRVDWPALARQVIEGASGLRQNPLSTPS